MQPRYLRSPPTTLSSDYFQPSGRPVTPAEQDGLQDTAYANALSQCLQLSLVKYATWLSRTRINALNRHLTGLTQPIHLSGIDLIIAQQRRKAASELAPFSSA
jgi:hypothetical protein